MNRGHLLLVGHGGDFLAASVGWSLYFVHRELDGVRGGLGAQVVHAGLEASAMRKCVDVSLGALAFSMNTFSDCDWQMRPIGGHARMARCGISHAVR